MGKDLNMEQLTDKGWKSMRQTLDREMPEKNRSRRGGWWWAAAALFVSVAFWGGWQWWWQGASHNHPALQASPVAASPAARQPTSEEKPTTTAVSIGTAAQPNKVTEMPVPATGETASKPTKGFRSQKNIAAVRPLRPSPSNPAASSSTTMSVTATAPQLVTAATASTLFSADILQQIVAQTITTSQLPETTENPLDKTTAPEATSIQQQLATTSTENSALKVVIPGDFQTLLAELPSPEAIALAQNPLLKPAKKSSPWQLGLTANALTSQFTAVNGFAAGVSVTCQPLRRWGLRSGLLYAHQKATASAFPVIAFTAYDYYNNVIADAAKAGFLLDNSSLSPNTAANSVTLDSLRTETLYAAVSSTSKLELPLLVFFQASPRLRGYGGMSLNYLLKANVDMESVVSSRFLNRAAQGNTSLLRATNAAALQELATASLPAFDTRLNLGLGWRVHKRLELHANWQYSFQVAKQATASAYAESLANGGGTSFDPNQSVSGNSYKVSSSAFTLGATFFLH